jgi:hypothetical protein
MKKMKKIIISSLILIGSISVDAQKQKDSKISFNVAAEIGIANGNFGVTHSLAIGATAQIEYEVNEKTRITANSGIIQYSGRSVSDAFKYTGVTAIPVLVGAKYYFSDNFYGAAQLGLSIFSGIVGSSKLTYSPGLGFMINEKIEALVKYTGYANLGGAFGVRVAYNL